MVSTSTTTGLGQIGVPEKNALEPVDCEDVCVIVGGQDCTTLPTLLGVRIGAYGVEVGDGTGETPLFRTAVVGSVSVPWCDWVPSGLLPSVKPEPTMGVRVPLTAIPAFMACHPFKLECSDDA